MLSVKSKQKTFRFHLAAKRAGAIAVSVAVMAMVARGELILRNGDTLAFLGDSITAQGQGHHNGYVNLVLRALAADGVSVKPIKAGIGGHKSDNMLARLDRDILSKKPNVMTVSCGINDVWHKKSGKGVSLEDYKRNMSAIFDKCAASNCQVVVLSATIFENKGMEDMNDDLAAYNAWLREVSSRRGFPFADLNTAMWKAHEENPSVRLTKDGVHMLSAGDRIMARGVLNALGFGDDRLAAIEWDSWKPVWVLCRFDLKPDADKGEYLAKTAKVLGAVRAEPGCLEYRLLGDCQTDWEKPQRFGERTLWMLEKWGSVVELKAHLRMPHMKAFGPTVSSMRSNATFHVLEDVIP